MDDTNTSDRDVVQDIIGDASDLLTDRREFMSSAAKLGVGGALLSFASSGGAAAAEDDETDSEAVSDIEILNFALTLEHLEANYYTEGLNKFSESDVEGFDSPAGDTFDGGSPRYGTYQKLLSVRDHEQAHVDQLTTVIKKLGGDPVEAAEYNFPYSNVNEFLVVAKQLEDVGVSAYAGAAPMIDSDELLKAAVSIHSVEARHAAYLRQFPPAQTPFPNAFDPARTMEEVLAIASQFIEG